MSRSLLAAAGVPAALLGNADGSLLRESQRQFLHTTVTPVARIAAEELALKLDTPGLRFDHSSMYASDITGRARAFGSMVKAGMDVQRAAILSVLISDED